MQIHISRNAVVLGVFTEDEVRAGMASGQFKPSDHAWISGMAEWKPLSQLKLASTAQAQARPVQDPAAKSGKQANPTPWEQEHTVGSGFRTIAALITSPRETLSNGTPSYREIATMGWLTMLVVSPLYVIADLVNADEQAAVLREIGLNMLRSLNRSYDTFSVMMKKVGHMLAVSQPKDLFDSIQGVSTILFLSPVISAFCAGYAWISLRCIGLLGNQSCRTIRFWEVNKAHLLGTITLWPFWWIVSMMPPGTKAALVFQLLFVLGSMIVAIRIRGASLALGMKTIIAGWILETVLVGVTGALIALGVSAL